MPHKQVTDPKNSIDGLSGAWGFQPEHPVVKQREVHIWRAMLEQPPAVVQKLRNVLSEDEREKADRFRFHQDGEHFILARGLLRTLLGRYMDLDPHNLTFHYNAYGKPSLDKAHHQTGLCFNLSHSLNMALYAITQNRRIGIDIEKTRTDFATDEIAERFFSAYEHAKIKALPIHQRVDAFFNCWTRKEAYIKAVGKGLSLPLDQFDVSLSPGEPAALLRVNDKQEVRTSWSLRELSPATGYKAAMAVDEHGLVIKQFDGAGLLMI